MEWIGKLCTQYSRGRIERREDCDWKRMRTKKNKCKEVFGHNDADNVILT